VEVKIKNVEINKSKFAADPFKSLLIKQKHEHNTLISKSNNRTESNRQQNQWSNSQRSQANGYAQPHDCP